jgi:cell wall-associated NlpC family hydrolase
MQNEMTDREKIVQEALSWKGTPYHQCARIKGVGADCGLFIAQVYENAGMLPHIEPGFYTAEHALHSSKEIFKGIVEKYLYPVKNPLPGDIILYKFGLCRSHAALVIDYPKIIHSYIRQGVIIDTDFNSELKNIEKGFYSIWKE